MSLVGGSLLRHSLDYPLEDVEAEILVDYEKASDDSGLNHQDIEHRKEFPPIEISYVANSDAIEIRAKFLYWVAITKTREFIPIQTFAHLG